MFLKFMSFARYVRGNFHGITEPDPRYFPERGIRLFGRLCLYLNANTALLRGSVSPNQPVLQGVIRKMKRDCLRLLLRFIASLADKLVYRWHYFNTPNN